MSDESKTSKLVTQHSALSTQHSYEDARMVSTTPNGQKIGHIVQVIGSTFDAEFDEGHLPEIYNALKIDEENKGVKLRVTGEVQQHLGGNRVRAVALGSTEGLYPGMKVLDSGSPVRVPR